MRRLTWICGIFGIIVACQMAAMDGGHIADPSVDQFQNDLAFRDQVIANVENRVATKRAEIHSAQLMMAKGVAVFGGVALFGGSMSLLPIKFVPTRLAAASLLAACFGCGAYAVMRASKCCGFLPHNQLLVHLKDERERAFADRAAFLFDLRFRNLPVLRGQQRTRQLAETAEREAREQRDRVQQQADVAETSARHARDGQAAFAEDGRNLERMVAALRRHDAPEAVARFECPICMGEYGVHEIVRLGCGHRACRECLLAQLRQAIQERIVDDMTCSVPDCLSSEITNNNQRRRTPFNPDDIEDIIVNLQADEKAYIRDRWAECRARGSLHPVNAAASGFKQCPGADCTNGWDFYHEEGRPDANPFTCEMCRNNRRGIFTYCIACRLRWDHHSRGGRILNCAEARQYDELLNRETPEGRDARQASEIAIQAGGYYCVNDGCNNVVIRADGCDHMICGRDTHGHAAMNGCGYDHCIRCLLPWEGHGQQWYGGGCAVALCDQLGRRNRWAQELQRWINAAPGRTPDHGCEHWIQLCNERGREHALDPRR